MVGEIGVKKIFFVSLLVFAVISALPFMLNCYMTVEGSYCADTIGFFNATTSCACEDVGLVASVLSLPQWFLALFFSSFFGFLYRSADIGFYFGYFGANVVLAGLVCLILRVLYRNDLEK